MKPAKMKLAALIVFLGSFSAAPVNAVSVDLVFFLDFSPSNDTRRTLLAGQMGNFIATMEADTSIDDVRMAVMGSNAQQPFLVQNLTDDVALLETAVTANLINSGGARDEDYLETMLAALSDQASFLNIDYAEDSLKSLVVLADEPDQSIEPWSFYQPIFAASGFLVDVIVPYTPGPPTGPDPWDQDWSCTSNIFGTPISVTANYSLPAVATSPDNVYSICDFDDDPDAFFENYTVDKIAAAGGGMSVVPLPASLLLFLSGLIGFGILGRRGVTRGQAVAPPV